MLERFLTFKGEKIHPDCFRFEMIKYCCYLISVRCDKCEEGLDGKSFVSEDSFCVCETCYQTHYAPRCARCCQAIVSNENKTRMITCNGQDFHLDCYTCNVSLSSSNIERIVMRSLQHCSSHLEGSNVFLLGSEELVCQKCYQSFQLK